MLRAAALVVLAACGGGTSAPPAPTSDPRVAPHPAAALDAGVPEVVEPVAGHAQPKRPGKPIEIVLRSSPVVSQVSVDGVVLGPTPQVWAGESGAEHEFAFTADKYDLARYRFVPITSGVVHARLEPLADETHPGSAAQQPPREVMPTPPPQPSVVEPAPPLAIDAGTPRGPTLPF